MRKKLLLAIAILLFCCFAKAQDNDKTRIYEVRSNIAVAACDVIGNRLENNGFFSVPPYNARFALVKTKNDSVVVRFLTWSRSDSLRKTFNDTLIHYNGIRGNDSTVKINRYFLIAKSDLDSNCIKVFATGIKSGVFTLGFVTMPMKLRLGENFDFQGNLSLGTTAGIKFRISKYNPNYLNLLVGASISTVSLDSFSTKGKVTGQPLTNIAVFSPSIGMVFEFGKAQAGIFYGWDLLNKSTQSKYEWIYDRKPWISVGFGFSIFSVDSKSSNQNQTQSAP
jgi:hypothetical protein